MKIRLTENDIRKMVYEGVKALLKESFDMKSAVSSRLWHEVAIAYERAFGEKAPLMEPNMYGKMQARYDQATPREKENFETLLNGGQIDDDVFDLMLDDEI